MRSGIEEDRRDHKCCSGPGGGPNREKRPYRLDRTIMPDKDVATLKYSMSLEEVERILTRHLSPWLELGLGINVEQPSIRTLEHYIMTFVDKSIERLYKTAKDRMKEEELKSMRSKEDIFELLKSSIRDGSPRSNGIWNSLNYRAGTRPETKMGDKINYKPSSRRSSTSPPSQSWTSWTQMSAGN